ncbi:GNAT family N-acetyltransferase [Candidatus Thorarchaeota archaeon]|nr:MAG: GNAT family N-acetyltransferase [Candidatus Thorarchaeota archaeon]
MEIRLALDGEEKRICHIHNTGFASYISDLNPLYGWREMGPQDVRRWMTQEGSSVWVSVVDGQVVGYAQTLEVVNHGLSEVKALWLAPTPRWEFGQSNIVMDSEYQGRNLASQMLDRVAENARTTGIHLIQALVFSDNEPAEHLFKSAGFMSKDILIYDPFSTTEPLGNSSVYVSLPLKDFSPKGGTDESIRIRAAAVEDAEALAKIHRANVWWDKTTWSEEWNRNYARGEYGHHVLVVEVNGRVVGAMDYYNRGTIGISGVLPEFQKRGIGSALFDRLLEEMKNDGIGIAFADSGLTQAEAISMYECFGFTEERRQNLWTLHLREDVEEAPER